MIELSEALDLVVQNAYKNTSELVAISQASNRVLTEDIIAPINLPPFDASAMDGWAVNTNSTLPLKIQGESKAGSTEKYNLQEGHAIQIFTGSAIPDGADCVIRIEDITKTDDTVDFDASLLIKDQFIRHEGNHVQKDNIVLEKGQKLQSAGIALIQHLGITEVQVRKNPKVSVFVTGDELVDPGQALEYGQIYESNSIMIQSALEKDGITDINIIRVEDSLDATIKAIETEKESDILIFSGGISVGDHDYVQPALNHFGLQTHFYKVRSKPGKPALFGEINNQAVFALPGNPASALVSYLTYVRTYLKGEAPVFHQGKLAHDFNNRSRRPSFVRSKISNEGINILDGQDSHVLKSFAKADAICLLTEERQYSKGEVLPYIIFDL